MIDLSGASALVKIAIIDLVLSGDNAVVIALSVRGLPDRLRRRAIIGGTAGAILFRFLGLFVVVGLFEWPYVRLLGGVVLVGIAIQLLSEQRRHEQGPRAAPRDLKGAIATIIAADAVMSIDNLVGIVAAAGGRLLYVLLGLIGSIPLLMISSEILSRWLDRHRPLVWASGALLGWVAGELMLSDQVLNRRGAPDWIQWSFPAASAALVLAAAGLMILRRRLR